MILWADHDHPEWADHYRAHGTTRTVTTLPAPACPNLPDCEVSWEPVNAYGLGPDVKERVCLTHDGHGSAE